jgi:hypothetical protein
MDSNLLVGRDPEWKKRLRALIENSGRSMREISMSANFSRNFVFQILEADASVGLDNFLLLCKELRVSPCWVIGDGPNANDPPPVTERHVEVDDDTKRLLKLWSKASLKRRLAIVALLENG